MWDGEFKTNRIEHEITSVEEFGKENLFKEIFLETSYKLFSSCHELNCGVY